MGISSVVGCSCGVRGLSVVGVFLLAVGGGWWLAVACRCQIGLSGRLSGRLQVVAVLAVPLTGCCVYLGQLAPGGAVLEYTHATDNSVMANMKLHRVY